MDTSKSPAGSVKRHSRNVSHPLPRRNTRGPLDAADDPLAETPQSPSAVYLSNASSPTSAAEPPQQQQSQSFNAEAPEKPLPDIDLSFLQDPSSYHQLSVDDIPTAFVESHNQPHPDAALTDLLLHGHYRRAAASSLKEIYVSQPNDAEQIFQLLYTRLACLVLISRADVASVEAASMTDFLARNAPGADELAPLIPWELRLLLVRLQSIAAADGGRRGIMALYALSTEVRARIRNAQDEANEADLALWSHRLSDLGLRVADTLVEMGELETATRHLDTLVQTDGDELAYRKALLRLRIGDVMGAQKCIEKVEDTNRKITFDALLESANHGITECVATWQSLVDDHPDDALFASNLAVGLLYAGKLPQARDILEELPKRQPAFAGLLFNLGTVYELCTERALECKTALTSTIATKAPSATSGGWERSTFEFKL